MNITVQNQHNRPDAVNGNHAEGARTYRAPEKQKTNTSEAVNVSFSAGEGGLDIFGIMGEDREGHEKPQTMTELQQQAAFTDVGVSQDYMTLMSHTMSEEDFQKLAEEGFRFASLEPEEAVTIVDKIKAELVRSGKQIVGYTDDLDMDTLAAAVGSDALARALSNSFQEADIPFTKENVAAVEKAWNMACGLNRPTEGAYQYMVDNEMEPELWNFYLAQNSGADSIGKGAGASSADLDFLEDEKMQAQIDRMLEQAEYEVNEENRQSARWLLARRLPLTAGNLERLYQLRKTEIPVTAEAFAEAAANALAEGRDPIYADLSPKDDAGTIYQKAAEVLEFYSAKYESLETFGDDPAKLQEWLEQQGNLDARRQLEEIRLRMTAEVNVKLLKSGFAIDTAPMEQLIEALRHAQKEVAESYFPGDAGAVSKYENWNETNRVVGDLPTLPAQLLGTVRMGDAGSESATVLEKFHAEGVVLRQTYERAGESYEALMTVPRADLGDSMSKAFGNVEELVQELGLKPEEEVFRAVRILGYNHMEITKENVDRVREADAQVQTLIGKMTPAATLQMIRDGINPLESSFEELNGYFDSLPESFREASESYSRYLYGLEQNHQITEQERESYIGMYRLLRQIEKKDGAVIGSVVNTRAELQFSNLLSAVRSGKFRHMDVRASDELGVLRTLVREAGASSISEQIQQSYAREGLAQLRRLAETDAGTVAMLQRGEMPLSAENLLAAQDLIKDFGSPFKLLRSKAEKLRGEIESGGGVWKGAGLLSRGEELWESLSDRESFRENYDAMLTDLQAEAETLALDHAETSLDVRGLQSAHIQLGIMGGLAHSEEYILSMYVGEEPAAVHLTFEKGTAEKGGIHIEVTAGENTHLEAHLQVKNHRVEGFLLGKTTEEVRKLQEASDIFYNLVNKNASLDLEATTLPVVSRGNINMTGTSESGSQGEDPSVQDRSSSPENGTLYRVAKLFLQAIK